MLINEFQIYNYKSFRATPPISLSPGFNIFIGRNNAGKTALLEALSLATLANKPHRHSGIPSGQPLNQQSRVEVLVTLTPGDLRQALLRANGFWFPMPSDVNQGDYIRTLHRFTEQARELRFYVLASGNLAVSPYPSHGMFSGLQTGRSVQFVVNDDRNSFRINQSASNDSDDVFVPLGGFAKESIYTFRAERLSLAAHQYGDTGVLAANAQNLPVVLNVLQGQHDRFERFNALVNRVFPSIRRVSVRPRGGNFEIMVWNVDAPSDRVDLAIELSESGTGVGQVLAMLYIIVTSESPRTIIIDEPNIFLHPGAIRQLIEILRADSIGHQYIVTTHSPEIIRISEAERVHVVERREEQSHVVPLNLEVSSFRRALVEVGARLSDLFGADNIIWVEGPTEEECFPRIITALSFEQPRGFAVIAVRATGDFDGRRADAVAIWEIYHRLSTTGTLMPATLAISLDTDGRTEADIEKAKQLSRGLIRFLPRRCFENYLIHPAAITAVLGSLQSFAETPVAPGSVETWLRAHGGDPKYKASQSWTGDFNNSQWACEVRGALLLHDLFADTTQARDEYRKVEHGVALTEWICAHEPQQFAELGDYMRSLLAVQT